MKIQADDEIYNQNWFYESGTQANKERCFSVSLLNLYITVEERIKPNYVYWVFERT